MICCFRVKFPTRGHRHAKYPVVIVTQSDSIMALDSGMVVVIIISTMYMVLVFGLLFHVKNDWCDLLFKNFTVSDI